MCAIWTVSTRLAPPAVSFVLPGLKRKLASSGGVHGTGAT